MSDTLATHELTAEYVPRTVAYPDNAVLTPDEVAAWLDVSTKEIRRYGIKCVQLGGRTTRYIASDVYEFLRARAA